MKLKELKERIVNRKAKVGVIGLGYVGLPLAVIFALIILFSYKLLR